MEGTRKQFSQDYLIGEFRRVCGHFCQGSDLDALASGLAVFVFKHPSLLSFDEAYKKSTTLQSNLQHLFHCAHVPCDTQMRVRLDEIDLTPTRHCFRDFFKILQRGKTLEEFVFYKGTYLVSLDGTGYFSSSKVHCDQCCQKVSGKGEITYYHQMLSAALVHPGQRVVFPFAPEMIQKQDGTSKNDCERQAAGRWVGEFRREHPHLGVTLVADGLYANAPFIKLLKDHKMSYILVLQEGDHQYLADWFNAGEEPDKHRLEINATNSSPYQVYTWMNGVPLNATTDLLVNVIKLQETRKEGKTSTWMWVTDHTVDAHNVLLLSKGGRARWKIENETFNTLKNQGYNFEHNYGHGYKNLSYIFAHLMLLAFFIDQILQKVNKLWNAALLKIGAKYRLWEKMRNFIDIVLFQSFESLYAFLSDPPQQPLSRI